MNFFQALWDYFQTIRAPAVDLVPTPVPSPALSQEQFPAGSAEIAYRRHEDERLEHLYHRVVRANNANVTRDYGHGPVTLTDDRSVPLLTGEEMVELAGERAGVKFAKPPAPKLPTRLCPEAELFEVWYPDACSRAVYEAMTAKPHAVQI